MTTQNHTTNVYAIFFLVIICLNANVLQAQDFRPPARGLQVNQPLQLSKKYSAGMVHGEALFGVPEYGSKRGPLRIVDAMEGNESTGCDKWTLPASIKNAGPFFVLVNRGKCHFTEKVAHAQAQGARGVIVKDNKYLRGQPVSFCPGPHYEEPKRKNTGNNIWEPCVAETGSAANTDQCYCYETGKTIYGTTNKAKPLPTMPQCADGGETAEYVPAGGQCDPANGISAPCWKCTDGTFHASNCVLDQQNCVDEYNLPFMSDDGNGGTISIPSFIVSDYDGEMLRQAIQDEDKYGPVFITMAWEVPQLETVDYEIWTSSEDHNGAEFKRDFQEVALDLIDKTNFRPRFFIYDGVRQGCMRAGVTCSNQCIMDGRYCAPDPDDNFETSISGADIVTENLRQMCIWDVLTKEVIAKGGKDNTPLIKWWCYANKFANDCYGEDAAMVSSEKFAQCAKDTMDNVKIDKVKVQACIDSSGGVMETCSGTAGSCRNKMLEKEILDRSNYGIITLPTIVVNGVVLRGESESSGGAAEALAARAICRAFAIGFAPEVCERWLNPIATSNGAGQASISFTATLSSTANEKMEYNPEIASRLISTLSLKLGVERTSIKLGKSTSSTSCSGGAAKCFLLPVTLTNLLCTDEKDETETVAQLLNKVGSCEQNVVTAASASKEVQSLEGKAFYFHTHVTNDGVTHVITARMSNLQKDCKALGGAKGQSIQGVSVGVVITIVVLLLVVIGATGFLWYRRVRNDMQMQVQSILAQYQPLEEMNSKKDESDTAPML